MAKAWLDRDARLAEAMHRSNLKKTVENCEQNFVKSGVEMPRVHAVG
ncbi:hypothetical protein [Variovorax sp. CF079]|nr:hypothetical protein [Variovorax sp. CF079]